MSSPFIELKLTTGQSMIVNAVYIKEVRDGGGRTSKFSLIGSDLEYTADASYAELTKQWEQILR